MTSREQAALLWRLARATPAARRWVGQLLRAHRPIRRAISDYGMTALEAYFPGSLLQHAGVVEVDQCPQMPLAQWGLVDLDAASPTRVRGVAYMDTFFIRRGEADESLFFHELVHVAQWRHVGFMRFAMLYGLGLALRGYRDAPLEESAYRLQARFDVGEAPFDAEVDAIADVEAVADSFRLAGPVPRLVWGLAAAVPPPRV
jgi:hypothetical protein